jgi:hypothetical protein
MKFIPRPADKPQPRTFAATFRQLVSRNLLSILHVSCVGDKA